MVQSGFSTLGAPDVLNLIPGASAVQTIWCDTTVRTVTTTGRQVLTEKVLPGETLVAGGVLELGFAGYASAGGGAITYEFVWDGNVLLTLPVPTSTNLPFYIDIMIAQDRTMPQQIFTGKAAISDAPARITMVGSFADVTQDILMQLMVTQSSAQNSTQLALAYAMLLNSRGPI